jgi:ATP-dependent Clp protease ATP-binding subunit ClpC
MKKQNFLRWYYSAGMREWFDIWRRFVSFVPYYFSITLLLKTLFSPWHRDISPKTWRGFDPIKSTKKIVWNLFSRIIGAFVRLCVIFFALVVWLFVIVGGAFIVAIYVFAPIFLLISLALLITPQWIVGVSFAVAITLIVVVAYIIYKSLGHEPYEKMDIMQLHQQKWFYRVYERIGVTKEQIPEAVLHNFEDFKDFLHKKDIKVEEFEKIIAWEIQQQNEREKNMHPFASEHFLSKRPIGLNWHFGYTTELDKYATDLTRFDTSKYVYAKFYGFADEMELLEIILSRSNENSAILIGQPGVGRHMMIHELARRIRSGYFKGTFMQHMRVLECDFGKIISQSKQEGEEPENVIHHLFYEAAYAGNVILVVDDLEKYMNTKEQHGFSFITIIDKYASLTSFRMIGLASEEAFHEEIADKQSFLKNFDVVPLREMSEEETMHVLFTRFYGKSHTPFTYQALKQIISSSNKYTNTAPLPARAIDLAMSVFTYWERAGSGFITRETVDEYIRTKTGVPVGKITEEESDTLMNLESIFATRVVGQASAINAVAMAVRKMRSGVNSSNKPSGSFLFLGPTGTGKTEMARVLAKQYFGSEDKVIRLDMSEFQGDNAIDKLIGSKELKQQGILTTAVKEHPYALLLLDEIEKANPQVLDLFLQVLDEGFLHDAFGRKINFTTMIIIATSNVASITIKKMIEAKKDEETIKKQVIDTIINDGIFRPEFLNRFGDVIIFHPLTLEDVAQVTEILLKEFEKRMEQEHNIDLIFDEGVVQKIIAEGYDPIFGARSLSRYIDSNITDSLAKKLIQNDIQRGDTVHFIVEDVGQ